MFPSSSSSSKTSGTASSNRTNYHSPTTKPSTTTPAVTPTISNAARPPSSNCCLNTITDSENSNHCITINTSEIDPECINEANDIRTATTTKSTAKCKTDRPSKHSSNSSRTTNDNHRRSSKIPSPSTLNSKSRRSCRNVAAFAAPHIERCDTAGAASSSKKVSASWGTASSSSSCMKEESTKTNRRNFTKIAKTIGCNSSAATMSNSTSSSSLTQPQPPPPTFEDLWNVDDDTRCRNILEYKMYQKQQHQDDEVVQCHQQQHHNTVRSSSSSSSSSSKTVWERINDTFVEGTLKPIVLPATPTVETAQRVSMTPPLANASTVLATAMGSSSTNDVEMASVTATPIGLVSSTEHHHQYGVTADTNRSIPFVHVENFVSSQQLESSCSPTRNSFTDPSFRRHVSSTEWSSSSSSSFDDDSSTIASINTNDAAFTYNDDDDDKEEATTVPPTKSTPMKPSPFFVQSSSPSAEPNDSSQDTIVVVVAPGAPFYTGHFFDIILGMVCAVAAMATTCVLEMLSAVVYLIAAVLYNSSTHINVGGNTANPVLLGLASILMLCYGAFALVDASCLSVSVLVAELFGCLAWLVTAWVGGCAKGTEYHQYIRKMCHLIRWSVRGFHQGWQPTRAHPLSRRHVFPLKNQHPIESKPQSTNTQSMPPPPPPPPLRQQQQQKPMHLNHLNTFVGVERDCSNGVIIMSVADTTNI